MLTLDGSGVHLTISSAANYSGADPIVVGANSTVIQAGNLVNGATIQPQTSSSSLPFAKRCVYERGAQAEYDLCPIQ